MLDHLPYSIPKTSTSHSLTHKRQSMNTPCGNIDKLVRENILKNKERQLAKELEMLQREEVTHIKKQNLVRLNEEIKRNNHKLMPKKKKQKNKNLTVKLEFREVKEGAKNSIVQEFKRIKKEVEEEIKKDDRGKVRNFSGVSSPKGMTRTRVEEEVEDETRKRSIRKFMKQKKRKFKKEKILERSQEIKRHFKVKENLKLLNKYVKHMRTNSSGVYYNRTSGAYEQRK